MAFAFDTLGSAKRLRDAGVPQTEAEAHAEAAREFVMAELVTRFDLDVARRELEGSIAASEQRTKAQIVDVRHELVTRMDRLESRLDSRMGNLELRLMVRLSSVIAVGIAILAAVIKF